MDLFNKVQAFAAAVTAVRTLATAAHDRPAYSN